MKYLLGVTLALVATMASSAEDQWTEKVKISEIYTGYTGGYFLFKTSKTHVNPAKCSNSALYSVEPSKIDAQSVLSTLLAAKMSNTDVKIAISGSHCGSTDHAKGKPAVSRVGIF